MRLLGGVLSLRASVAARGLRGVSIMSRTFRLLAVSVCAWVLSCLCYLWACAVAGESGPDSFACIFPVLWCVAFSVVAVVVGIVLIEIGRDE